MSKKRIDVLFDFEKGLLQSSKCEAGDFNFITASAEWKTHKEFTHDCEALIFAAAASGSLGRTHYVNGKFISSDLCFILTPKNTNEFPVDLPFYHLIFNSLREEIVRNTKAGTSKEAIGLGVFGRYELPYFPIEKQQEISKKYREIEAQATALTTTQTQQLHDLKQLRQALLKEAVSGKLLPQNPADEPTTVLLEKIRAEKAALLKAKKIKKVEAFAAVKPEEMPFLLPEGWVWVRLGEILTEIKYGTSQSCNYDSSKNSAVLRIPNISSGTVDAEDLKFTDLSIQERRELSLEENDILLIRSNGSRELVGKTVLVPAEFVGFAFAGYLIRLRFNKILIEPKFLWMTTIAPFFRELIETPLRTTVGINNINTTEISNLLIPLPPLAEQTRIVQKLETQLAHCAALEKQVQQSKTETEALLGQVLREALAV